MRERVRARARGEALCQSREQSHISFTRSSLVRSRARFPSPITRPPLLVLSVSYARTRRVRAHTPGL